MALYLRSQSPSLKKKQLNSKHLLIACIYRLIIVSVLRIFFEKNRFNIPVVILYDTIKYSKLTVALISALCAMEVIGGAEGLHLKHQSGWWGKSWRGSRWQNKGTVVALSGFVQECIDRPELKTVSKRKLGIFKVTADALNGLILLWYRSRNIQDHRVSDYNFDPMYVL